MAGITTSSDRDVRGYHDMIDAWVVKVDKKGTIQWQRCLGGSHHDLAYDMRQTSDGGYIVVGYTSSTDGDVIGNHEFGYDDVWIVKLDKDGSIQWQSGLSCGVMTTGSKSEQIELVPGYSLVFEKYLCCRL